MCNITQNVGQGSTKQVLYDSRPQYLTHNDSVLTHVEVSVGSLKNELFGRVSSKHRECYHTFLRHEKNTPDTGEVHTMEG